MFRKDRYLDRFFLVFIPYLYRIFEATLKKHGVFYHKFADDLQMYVFFNPGDPADRARAVKQIQDCISEICSWMVVNKLKLNPPETEFIILQLKHHFESMANFRLKLVKL